MPWCGKKCWKQHVVGLTLGIIRNGEVVYMKGYGFADREYSIPAEVSTIYRFASLSKVITSVAALHAWGKRAPESPGRCA